MLWTLGIVLASPVEAATLQPPLAIVPGTQATFTLVDGTPGQQARLVRGGSGAGPCPGGLGGLCLSVSSPSPVDSAVVDGSGRASFTVAIPQNAPLGFGRFQAIELGATPSVSQVATVPVTATRGDACSTFDATEDPISDGGLWGQQGGLSGLDWTNVRSAGGIAFGTQTGFDGYDDSIALLTGFGADQRVSAVVRSDGARSPATGTHEVELILRGSYTPQFQTLYECNLGYAGDAGWYAQIVVLDGPIGTFRDITIGLTSSLEIHDGDLFTAEIVGDTIRTYVNGEPVAMAVDGSITSGQPGIGFFWRGTENVDDFAYTEMCATGL
ncbi:MAG: hypothetical protein ABMB14_17495 [Myxococcota bacterium]